MLEPLTTIIFKHQVVGGRAAVEPKLEFSGAPKGYLRMSFLSRCEQLSKPQTLEPITQLSLLASYFYKKKGKVQKGHFWGRKGTGYFTYPHTMHYPEAQGISHYGPGWKGNLGPKCVDTAGRQLAEFGWLCCVWASCAWLQSFSWSLIKGMRAALALNLHKIKVTEVWFGCLT